MVAFDSVGPSAAGAGSSGSSALNWTHTVAAGPSTVLVFVSVDNLPTTSPATCTIGGTAATSIGITPSGAGGTTGYLQAFVLHGVAAGAQAVAITRASANDMEGGSLAFTAAGALGTVALNSSTAASGTVNVPASTAGNLIAAGVGAGNSVASTSAPATSRFVNNLKGVTGFATGNAAGATSPAGGSVTTTWGLTASTPYAAIAVEVLAPGGAAGLLPQQLRLRAPLSGRTAGPYLTSYSR